MSKPKLAMADKLESTVLRIFYSPVHDLTILNILTILKHLNTVIAEDPNLKKSSKPTITTIASKILNPSLKYYLNPNPNTFNVISPAKIIVNTEFPVLNTFANPGFII